MTALTAIASTARTHCNLTHCILTYCNLTHCTLIVTTLTHCNLIHCALTCCAHSYYRHPPTAAPLTAPPSLCSHLMRSQEGRGDLGHGISAALTRLFALTLLSSDRIKRASARVSVRKKTKRKERGSRVTMAMRHNSPGGGDAASAGRSPISCSPLTSFAAPAPSIAPGVVYITQVRKRRQRTRRGAHTWFFTALPFLSPFLISLYSAAFVLIFLLATSSHLPPTSQLVQPAETPTGGAPQRHGSM